MKTTAYSGLRSPCFGVLLLNCLFLNGETDLALTVLHAERKGERGPLIYPESPARSQRAGV